MEKCSDQRRLDEMIEFPFFSPDDDAHVGERGGRGGNRGTVLDELAAEGEGGKPAAYGSVHRRLDHPEGRVRRTFKTLHVWEPST